MVDRGVNCGDVGSVKGLMSVGFEPTPMKTGA